MGEVPAEHTGERVVVMGRIGGAFGVAGWVKIESFTDPPENLLQYPTWLIRHVHTGRSGHGSDEWKAMRWEEGYSTTNGLRARLTGASTRDHAIEWRGSEIGIRRSELPPLKAGEYYWDDLIGLRAVSLDGAPLGEVKEILAGPAHPLLRIEDRGRGRETLVPLVRERLKAVDLSDGRITLDWQADWLHEKEE